MEEIILQSDEAETISHLEESLQSNEAQQIPVLEETSIEADVLPGNELEVARTVVTDSIEDFSSINEEEFSSSNRPVAEILSGLSDERIDVPDKEDT